MRSIIRTRRFLMPAALVGLENCNDVRTTRADGVPLEPIPTPQER